MGTLKSRLKMAIRCTLPLSLLPFALVACALLLITFANRDRVVKIKMASQKHFAAILRDSTRSLYGEEMNVTYHGNKRPSLEILPTPGIIIYNRVGKCGSRTVLSMIKLTLKSRTDDVLKVRYLEGVKTGNSTALT